MPASCKLQRDAYRPAAQPGASRLAELDALVLEQLEAAKKLVEDKEGGRKVCESLVKAVKGDDGKFFKSGEMGGGAVEAEMVCNMVRCAAILKPAHVGVPGLVEALVSLLPVVKTEGNGSITASSVCMPPEPRAEGSCAWRVALPGGHQAA